MKNSDKYAVGYFPPPTCEMRWAQKDHLEKAPIWCSVDLRDGNQSLIVPMSLEEKLDFFAFLVKIGFREIEVGFPAASDTEYTFLRTLIERDLIPEDVTVQVLTQSREHIIRKTFEALRGVRKAVVHLYNSTSVAQREQVFRKSKAEIIDIAVSGAKLLRQIAEETPGDFRFEYSPESFTGTEMEFALEICNRVLNEFAPTAEKPVIINLPVTVSMSMPHVYANQIEYMCDHLKYREQVIVSLHPHNDRGCAVADSELGLLAGADRVEGTLFGNGERTGNVDLITLALNLFAHGVDPELDFSDMPAIISEYERVTRMHVYERQPYSGELVFAAFSGSHQDAITKGMKWREENQLHRWTVPYLPIDPKDIGRQYDGDIIRINSQSGKGGIGYLLQQKYGFELPAKMREDFGYAVKRVSDQQHKELMVEEIYEIFSRQYLNVFSPLDVTAAHFTQCGDIRATITIGQEEQAETFEGVGNGRLDAVSNALRQHLHLDYHLISYQEHALEMGTGARAAAYVAIQSSEGRIVWGAGTHADIMAASVNALVSAINRMGAMKGSAR